jgi:hypothetical protein
VRTSGNPTVQRRRLAAAAELRELRYSGGWTGDEVARALGGHHPRSAGSSWLGPTTSELMSRSCWSSME